MIPNRGKAGEDDTYAQDTMNVW